MAKLLLIHDNYLMVGLCSTSSDKLATVSWDFLVATKLFVTIGILLLRFDFKV